VKNLKKEGGREGAREGGTYLPGEGENGGEGLVVVGWEEYRVDPWRIHTDVAAAAVAVAAVVFLVLPCGSPSVRGGGGGGGGEGEGEGAGRGGGEGGGRGGGRPAAIFWKGGGEEIMIWSCRMFPSSLPPSLPLSPAWHQRIHFW